MVDIVQGIGMVSFIECLPFRGYPCVLIPRFGSTVKPNRVLSCTFIRLEHIPCNRYAEILIQIDYFRNRVLEQVD